MKTQHITVVDYFKSLVESLPSALSSAFNNYKHSRQEIAFAGREFAVYKMVDGKPEIMDLITVTDFSVGLDCGAKATVFSKSNNKFEDISYTPKQVFGYPFFVFLALHSQIRWEPWRDTPMSFPVVVRTSSRYNLHEQGVVYFETTAAFEREFGTPALF